MNLSLLRRAILSCLLAALWSGLWSPGRVQADQPALTLGVLAFRSVPETLERWQPLADYIRDALDGRPVNLVAANYQELEELLDRNALDFVLTNPSHYIVLGSRNALSGALATMIVDEQGHQLTGFGGVVLTLKERADIATLADLKGKALAAVDEESLGGYRAQVLELRKHGIKLPRDSRVEFTDTPHDKVVEAVLSGRADAGFVRTGVIEGMARQGKLDLGRIKVLNPQNFPGFPFAASTRLYPEWPFVALPHVDRKVARRVAAALLVFTPDEATVRATAILGFGVPADYQPVEDLARTLRLAPYDAMPAFDIVDVWTRYRWQVVAAVIALTLTAALAVWLAVTNRRLAEARAHADANACAVAIERKRLADIIWGTGVGTWEWNAQTGETLLNERWAELVGYTLDELQPVSFDTWAKLAHPEDLERTQTLLRRHFAGEVEYFECEARMRHKDGHWVWVLDRAKVVEWTADGKPLWVAGTHMDITHRKRIEQIMESSHQRLDRLLEASPAVIYAADPRTYVPTYLSANAVDTLGMTPEEILGQPTWWVDHLHPEDRDRVLAEAEEWFAKGAQGLLKHHYRLRRGDGVYVWVEDQLRCLRDADGIMIELVGSHVDITDRKEVELAARRVSERLRMILDSASEGIYGLDNEGQTIFANRAAAEMLGWSQDEMLGKTQHELTRHSKADGTCYSADDCPIRRAQQDAQVREVTDALFRRRDGTAFPVEYIASPVAGPDGRASGAMVVFRNVSERTKLLHQLERSNAELEQFAYVVSHDLRQPLRMITSYTQLLEHKLEGMLDEDAREFMHFVRDGAVRMDQMLLSLLEYSRVGRKGPPMEQVDLREVLDDALLYLGPDIREVGAKVTVTGEWSAVFASRDEMTRVFENLIGNAIKYRAPERRPEIRISAETAGDRWGIAVRDNGIGIEPAQFGRLFQMFQRLHGRGKYEGTGIGLALCRKIVERHGGTIWIESEGDDKGSAFIFTLPKGQAGNQS